MEDGAADSLMGEMHRAISREAQERRKQDQFASTLVIAASTLGPEFGRIILVETTVSLSNFSSPLPRPIPTQRFCVR